MFLLERYGTLPLRAVMQYAIGYAEHGYPMLPAVSDTIAAVAGTFREHWPGSAEIYLASGVPAPGSRFTNRPLAGVYQRILTEAESAGSGRERQIEAARSAFYSGFVADAISDYLDGAVVMDITGHRNQGLLTGADMAGWRASAEAPVTAEFRGLTVCKTGPWGQGPVFLQQLALLDGMGIEHLQPGGADLVHTITEAAKLAFADREAWYGDPRQTPVPLAALLSAEYAASRRALIGPDASGELRPGSPEGIAPRLPGFALASFGPHVAGTAMPGAAGTGEPTAAAGGRRPHDLAAAAELGPGDTCHLDVADRFGNMVSATPSGGWLQSSPVIPGLGFCLGTRAQMFTLTPGLASTLAPGRRPRTTLSPGLALRDGAPYLAFGTPGGDQQDQWPVAFFLNHVLFGMNLQEAIDAAAFHTDHFPSSFYPRMSDPRSLAVESRAGGPVIADLRARGHKVSVEPPWSLGRLSAVAMSGGFIYAAANPRGMQGYAVCR
jgi:gamma-glutamyltranspeptidase/glutathione hydrolase